MNVGILTFHRGPNYGGFLQAWHLREAVRALGHTTTVINYQNPAHLNQETIKFSEFSARGARTYLAKRLKALPFPGFVRELSDHPFTTDAAGIPWRRFDAVIVGSDVVWDFDNPDFGHDPAFFGALPCQKDTRFFAYAPSCGKTDVTGPIPGYVRDGLLRMTPIGVRDQSSARLVERVTHRSPKIVVDPTWLQADPACQWAGLPKEPYLLIYGGGLGECGRARALREHCDQAGLEIISAATNCKVADRVFRSINPLQWVRLFASASAVVTSTLHGTLYAIKNGKPLVLMENPNVAQKARTVIERCQLEESVVPQGSEFDAAHLAARLSPVAATLPPRDWVESSLKELREALG